MIPLEMIVNNVTMGTCSTKVCHVISTPVSQRVYLTVKHGHCAVWCHAVYHTNHLHKAEERVSLEIRKKTIVQDVKGKDY